MPARQSESPGEECGTLIVNLDIPELTDLPSRIVNNVALLCILICDGDAVVQTIDLVCAIDEREGVAYRTIFSPLV